MGLFDSKETKEKKKLLDRIKLNGAMYESGNEKYYEYFNNAVDEYREKYGEDPLDLI